MDSLGKPLIIGKYYQLQDHHRTQYTGMNDTGRNYIFEWIVNILKKRVVLIRTPAMLEEFHPILIDDDDTDNEYQENPYSGNKNT